MNRFKELRVKNGYKTQQDLAAVLFVNQTAVSQWERGVTIPSPPILLKLSELYGVSTDYLLGRTDEKSPAPGEAQNGEKKNVVRTIGRDGSYEERYLTDEQLEALKAVIRQMPKVEDDF